MKKFLLRILSEKNLLYISTKARTPNMQEESSVASLINRNDQTWLLLKKPQQPKTKQKQKGRQTKE